jgi:hypothetical protein
MVVGPGLLETVCQQFDGLAAAGAPTQKTCGGCTKSAHHPKNIPHCVDLFLLSILMPLPWCCDAARGLDAVRFFGVCR